MTQVWQKAGRPGVRPRRKGRPDLIVAIDSSGSMQHPRRGLSHAVLGAACAAEAYLRQEARVAVYNFSDASAGACLTLDFTRRRADVLPGLVSLFRGRHPARSRPP